MRAARTAAAGLIAGALALSLVAAETAPATTGTGSAHTSLLGAQVQVTGPLQTPVTRVLDITSDATTTGTPLAATSVVPLAVGDTLVGATGASSDGQSEASSDGGTVGDLTGALGATVQPLQTSASASADRAVATVGAAVGQVSALLGQLGLELDTTGVTSLVTQEGASATQGLQVSDLSLSLGDLGLDADLLGQLGLGNVLDLLAALPGLLPSDLADVGALQSQLDDLEAALASLAIEGDGAQSAITELTSAVQELANLESLQSTLGSLSLTSLPSASLLSSLDAVGCGLGSVTLLNLAGAVTDALACLGSAITDVSATVDSLTAALPSELDPVLDVLDGIVALLQDILAGVGDLDGLLSQLPDLLASAAGTELLGVGAFDVGTTAVAGPTTADSSAAVLCEAVDVTVLGTDFATPDCSDALGQLPDVTGAISDAVGQLNGVLNSLPLTDLVQVGDLKADLFTDVVEQVTETDGVVTSTAGFTLLDLAIPSITIDPSQVTDALGGLGLPDVMGPVQDVLGQLQSGLTTLSGLGVAGVDTALATVSDTLTQVGDPAGLSGTVDQVRALLAGLELGDLGSLTEQVSTPGLALLIDPVATATFAPAADGGTAAPAPTPAPAPAPQPTLPSTGGGLALLGVLALAGAGSLRRRS